jgi:hypothetical protein
MMSKVKMSTPRMTMECEPCGGEGRLWRSKHGGNDPYVWDAGGCPDCGGKGCVTVNAAAELEEWEEEFRADAPEPPTCCDCGRILMDGEVDNGMCADCIHEYEMIQAEREYA